MYSNEKELISLRKKNLYIHWTMACIRNNNDDDTYNDDDDDCDADNEIVFKLVPANYYIKICN